MRLVLLLRLVDGIEDAEIVLGVLEIALRHHAVAAAGRVAAELQVFLEKLLGGAAQAQIRPIAVEDVVAIERDVAAMVPDSAATPTAPTAAAATMVASAHAFHVVHSVSQHFPVRGPALMQMRRIRVGLELAIDE